MSGEASTRRKVYILVLITLAATVSLMDRSVMTILQEPVRHEFGLSDSQLGMLTGLGFAAAYAVVGLPFGVIADRVERSRLLAACLAVWSAMTALGALAGGFLSLLASRAAVGAAEAAGAPAAVSMVADLFTARRRGTAMAVYYLSTPVGSLLALLGGGFLAERYGWRAAFVAAGVPGFVLAVVMLLTVKAPPRRNAEGAMVKAPPVREVLRFIVAQRALAHMIVAMTVGLLVVASVGSWSPSFFLRYHRMSLTELGVVLGPVTAGTGMLGMLASGVISDRFARRDPRDALWMIVGALLSMAPGVLLFVSLPGPLAAVGSFAVYVLITNLWLPAAVAVTQNLAGPSRRGAVAALIMVATGLIGGGVGPLLMGMVSDLLRPLVGEDCLRWAMLGFALLSFWAAAHVLFAMRSYMADLVRAEAG
jgi:MFS family permease